MLVIHDEQEASSDNCSSVLILIWLTTRSNDQEDLTSLPREGNLVSLVAHDSLDDQSSGLEDLRCYGQHHQRGQAGALKGHISVSRKRGCRYWTEVKSSKHMDNQEAPELPRHIDAIEAVSRKDSSIHAWVNYHDLPSCVVES